MKTVKFYSLKMLVILSVLLVGCETFEDESPLAKMERDILGEWDMEKAFKNGASVGTVFENPQIGEITEDWWFFKNYDVATEDGNETLVGLWQFTDDANSLVIEISRPASKTSSYTYTILHLDQSNMVWEHELNGNLYRYEFRLSSKETPSSVDEI